MFNTILVPLDGSPLAEQVLPLAVSLARRSQGNLRLARVHGSVSARQQLTPEDHSLCRDEQKYLDVTAWRLREEHGVKVLGQLLKGPIAEALGEQALAARADLIVLTTHGRGSLSRLRLGSVTDDLLQRSPVSLLVHHPQEAPPDPAVPWACHRILVPLDGTELSEQVLAPVLKLARLFEAEVTLFHVVEPEPVLAPHGGSFAP